MSDCGPLIKFTSEEMLQIQKLTDSLAAVTLRYQREMGAKAIACSLICGGIAYLTFGEGLNRKEVGEFLSALYMDIFKGIEEEGGEDNEEPYLKENGDDEPRKAAVLETLKALRELESSARGFSDCASRATKLSDKITEILSEEKDYQVKTAAIGGAYIKFLVEERDCVELFENFYNTSKEVLAIAIKIKERSRSQSDEKAA